MDRNITDRDIDRLVEVFKTLADPMRLRILGRLAERPHTGKELSELLGLTPPTISHHMARLVATRLVTVTPDAQRRTYSLDETTLRSLNREVASVEAQEVEGAIVGSGYREVDDRERRERAKVVRDFFDGVRLKQIPAQRKKRVIVLQHLLTRFEPNREYLEKEVNMLLKESHEDVATLRRELVDYGFMSRANGVYRVAHGPPERSVQVAQEIIGDERAWFRALLDGATSRAIGSGS